MELYTGNKALILLQVRLGIADTFKMWFDFNWLESLSLTAPETQIPPEAEPWEGISMQEFGIVNSNRQT
jgi:hypothetical protein